MIKIFITIVLGFIIPVAALANTVDLVWEADAYVPPTYQGHTKAALNNRLKVVALAHFLDTKNKPLDPKTLDYQWVKDGQALTGVSGIGKHTIMFNLEGQSTLGVVVKIPNTDVRQAATTVIRPVDPEIILYEEDSLFGINYTKAVTGDYQLAQPEITLRAEPFNFNRSAVLGKRLQYDWQLNNQKIITDPAEQSILHIKQPTEGSGTNQLTVIAKNLSQILQTATAKLNISFQGNSLFNWNLLPTVHAQNNSVTLIPTGIPEMQNVTSVNSFISAALKNIITLLILATVIALAWYGMQYLGSNIPGMKGFAKVRIWDIVFGLILILGAYLILNTINPQINKPNLTGLPTEQHTVPDLRNQK